MKKLCIGIIASFVLLFLVTYAGAQGPSFAGTWETKYGVMELVVTGDRVNGTYAYDSGRITGVIGPDGMTLRGTWSESPTYMPPNDSGDVVFTLSPDGNSFTGWWWYGPQRGEGTEWSGTRSR